jgi:hypothetical protein
MIVYGGVTGCPREPSSQVIHGGKVHVYDFRMNDWETVFPDEVRFYYTW